MSVRILALVGSLRAGSTNRKLAEAAVKLAPEGVGIEIYEGLADVPFYNEDTDVDGAVPAAAARLRSAAEQVDALLLVTPQYNGTLPAATKNAIDWLSRPYGTGAIINKPVAVVGTSFGEHGPVWAHEHAHLAVRVAGGRPLEDLKLAVPGSLARFAEVHPIDDEEVVASLTEVLQRLIVEARSAAA